MSLIVLNFHGVGPVTRDIDEGERNCWLDRDNFERVLDLIHGHPHVRLTVDDGNASDAEIVMPALLERGLVASFFVCSGRVDETTFLTRLQLRELIKKRMAIGSHGIAHVSWRCLSPTKLDNELQVSRRVLSELCQIEIESAACPFGAYDRRVIKGLRRAGYQTVYTSDGGATSATHWICARTTITRCMKLDDIKRLVSKGPGPWKQSAISIRRLLKRLR